MTATYTMIVTSWEIHPTYIKMFGTGTLSAVTVTIGTPGGTCHPPSASLKVDSTEFASLAAKLLDSSSQVEVVITCDGITVVSHQFNAIPLRHALFAAVSSVGQTVTRIDRQISDVLPSIEQKVARIDQQLGPILLNLSGDIIALRESLDELQRRLPSRRDSDFAAAG
jgi:hypothetical protein